MERNFRQCVCGEVCRIKMITKEDSNWQYKNAFKCPNCGWQLADTPTCEDCGYHLNEKESRNGRKYYVCKCPSNHPLYKGKFKGWVPEESVQDWLDID